VHDARRTSTLFALDDADKMNGWFLAQHFSLLVTDYAGFAATLVALALLRRAGYDFLNTFQMCRQFVASRMMLPLALWLGVLRAIGQRAAVDLGFDFFARYRRLKIQQLQLQIREFLAARAVLAHELQTKLLFQLQHQHLRSRKRLLIAHKQRLFRRKIIFQLRDDRSGNRIKHNRQKRFEKR
jgi:hypothetical protein